MSPKMTKERCWECQKVESFKREYMKEKNENKKEMNDSMDT